MPIDPRIALQTQGIEVPGMANAYERFLNAKAQREATSQRSELHKAQMSEIQRRTEAEKQAEARATQAREVLGQGGKAADVMAIDPDLGMKLSKEERDAAAARTKATLDEYDAELKQLSISKQKLDRLGSIAGSINDETTFDIGVAQAIRLGLPPEMGAKLLAQGYTDESKKILDQFKMEAMTVDKQLEEKRAEVEAKYKAAEEARKSELHPMAVRKAENEVVTGTPDAEGLTPAQRATKALEKSRAEEAARHNRVSESQASQRLAAETASVDVSAAGVDMMAKAFASTGTMPAVGMGKSAADLRKKIIERAAELYPDLDIGSAKADFAANNKSLRELTALNDRVVAFENTASKNIDVFLDSAKGIVDAGSPILNRPLRAAALALGNEKMAAFEAARETALTEISKVLESPGGGAALTVSGREAVKNLSSDSATLGQQIAAMKVLKRDMENRKEENRKQIEAIRNRIKLSSSNTGGDADLKSLSDDELFKRLSQ
jgi:hypothetical protein